MLYYKPNIGGTLRKGWIAALLLLSPFTTCAKGNDWIVFRLCQLSVFQSVGKSFSGEVSWNPCFNLSDRFGIRGNIGTMVLKGFPDKFAAAEYEALLSFSFNKSLAVEAGGGMQTWFQEAGGTSPVFSLNAAWMFFRKLPGVRAGIAAGYSLFLPEKNTTHEVKLGVALAFVNERKRQ